MDTRVTKATTETIERLSVDGLIRTALILKRGDAGRNGGSIDVVDGETGELLCRINLHTYGKSGEACEGVCVDVLQHPVRQRAQVLAFKGRLFENDELYAIENYGVQNGNTRKTKVERECDCGKGLSEDPRAGFDPEEV